MFLKKVGCRASILILAIATASCAAAPRTTDLYSSRLVAMSRDDQQLREEFIQRQDSPEFQAFIDKMMLADEQRANELDSLILQYGFPVISMVGEDAARGAFLIMQHDPTPLQTGYTLDQVKAAVLAGDWRPDWYAMLVDKDLLLRTGKQRYGTQIDQTNDGRFVIAELEDAATVEALRAEVGLPPLAQYLKDISQVYGKPVVLETP